MLTLLLALSSTLSYASDGDVLPWQVTQAKESCSLSAALSGNSDITFVADAGEKPVLRLDLAFRNRMTQQARLFIIAPPWREHEPKVIANSAFKPASRLIFSKGIQRVMDAMNRGDWIRVSLTSDEGDTWSQDISAIGIANAMADFNDCRNQLPPVSLAQINNTKILYPSGSLDPGKSGRHHIQQIADYLKHDHSINAITIDAHTDRTGNHLVNLRISRQRAEYIRRLLIEAGIKPELITHVRGHGSRYPLNRGLTKKQQQANRRVEIKLLRTPPPVKKNEDLGWG